jgi:putative ABC transport system permease protein
MGDIIPSFVYLPYTTMQSLSGKESFDQIAVRVKGGVDEDVAGAQLVSVLERISGIPTGYRAENMQSQKNKLDGVLDIITYVLSAIAGVSLVVAGLSIMTVMLQSVGETREIGIKKSIGAGRRDILYEFLVEALTISVLGSLIGAVFGIAVVAVGCVVLGMAVRLSLELILFSIFFSILVGVVFGVYPASIAARLRPVEALRCE